MSYNGHANWSQWNQSLWINNDEGIYREAVRCIRVTRSRRAAAEMLLGMLPRETPDGAKYSLTGILNAMRGM